jgi:hypothetical protein
VVEENQDPFPLALGKAIAVDAAGSVFVLSGPDRPLQWWEQPPCGETCWGPPPGASPRGDYLVRKLGPGDELLWEARYDSGGFDWPEALALDAEGNVYVTGGSEVDRDASFATVKLDSEGRLLWAQRHGGWWMDSATDVAVDGDGNVYVTGWSERRDVHPDFGSFVQTTARYRPDGAIAWVRTGRGVGISSPGPRLLIGSRGGPVVAGSAGIVEYAPEGWERWMTEGETLDLALDPAGNVYALEWSEADDRWVAASYDPEGNIRWIHAPEAWSRSWEPASKGLALDGEGTVYVTGNWASDFATAKYVQAPARFRRGDANDDGEVSLADAVFVLDGLFLGWSHARCLAASNANGDAAVDLSDAVYVLGYLFLGNPAPPEPFGDCGPSPFEVDADLGCVRTPRSCP